MSGITTIAEGPTLAEARMADRNALLIPIVLLLACQAQQPGFTESDDAAIRETLDRYVSTPLAGDWDGFASLVTEDAVFLPPNAPPVKGRAAIREWITGFVGVATFTAPVLEVMGDGALAYTYGTYTIATRPDAPSPASDAGHWLAVLERQSDGTWLIKRNIWNSDQPLAPTTTSSN
jgi:uncharacterized protein (TIGR02246 family)